MIIMAMCQYNNISLNRFSIEIRQFIAGNEWIDQNRMILCFHSDNRMPMIGNLHSDSLPPRNSSLRQLIAKPPPACGEIYDYILLYLIYGIKLKYIKMMMKLSNKHFSIVFSV